MIKRHTVPPKCSQRFEIKIINSKEYDWQLNLTKSSIENQLLEITKKFKAFNFQQNLRIIFTKNIEVSMVRLKK